MKKWWFCLLLTGWCVTSCCEKPVVLDNLSLAKIQPEGWLHTMLVNQRNGLTGQLDTLLYPFTQGGWGSEPFLKKGKGGRVGSWVPFEQTAYYYDGVIRCGLLLRDTALSGRAVRAIYGAIDHASPEGIIEPSLSQGDRRRWPHAVFFRAMMAQYESSSDPRILEALQRHFLHDTVALAGRDLCNLEAMAWLYRQTGDRRIYDRIFAVRDAGSVSAFQEDEIGDFGSPEKQEIHGVTYNEMLKLPILFYMLTGDQTELAKARNGFAKLDRYHMLPDGVNSSEEGTSGKGARNTHEICDIVDYMWTCSYMLRATREAEWGDRMERALFNAGLGSITKNFDAHQYYSCPNQVYCADHSSHVLSYEDSRLAYRQGHKPPCCTGNVNRMFPVYVGNQWHEGPGGSLYKSLYGPGSVTHEAENGSVTIREESVYPYTDSIRLSVVQGEASFALFLRIPGWCRHPQVAVNGVPQKGVESGRYWRVDRQWKTGDVVELYLPKEAEFINWDGYEAMVVNYGPLLFALPVEAHVERKTYTNPIFNNMPYMGYVMTPASAWNYILGVDGTDPSMIRVEKRPILNPDNPWVETPQPLQLRVPMYRDPTWKEIYHKVVEADGTETYAAMTPPLPARGAMIFVLRRLKPEVKSLVPYGSTCLRISMFPFWKEQTIAPEVLATEW